MLVRVRKTDVQQFLNPPKDGLAYALDCWKYYMSGSGMGNLDAKPMGGMTANEDGYGRDPNEAQLAQDSKVGAATNAAIDSLAAKQKWAVYKTLGMGTVMTFNFSELLEYYYEASEEITKKLKLNYDTSYLF